MLAFYLACRLKLLSGCYVLAHGPPWLAAFMHSGACTLLVIRDSREVLSKSCWRSSFSVMNPQGLVLRLCLCSSFCFISSFPLTQTLLNLSADLCSHMSSPGKFPVISDHLIPLVYFMASGFLSQNICYCCKF